MAISALALLPLPAAAKIDRKALVSRHNITLTQVDPHAPLMLGNGDLGFTADITGLQTFPERYSKLAPLLTMAQWAWHSFPNPRNYTEADGMVPVFVRGRGMQQYPWIRDWAELETKPALRWLRENPHRFSLGRISLMLTRADGTQAAFADLSATRQQLDLWNGMLTSSFMFDGQPVTVETRVHPTSDEVLVSIRSPLVASGRVGIDVRFPGVSKNLNPDPQDWSREDLHSTRVTWRAQGRVVAERKLDATTYYAGIETHDGVVEEPGLHRLRVVGRGGDRLSTAIVFDRNLHEVRDEGEKYRVHDFRKAVAEAAYVTRRFWKEGGAIDFSGSTDPRARELERRVVLSQYLSLINGAGDFPPQEEGLFSNSWNGKFHLEVHPLHSAHWAPWGRPFRLTKGLGWYLGHLDEARRLARVHRVEGAWWTKMSGPDGRNSPSTINPFIMWQQPNPIFMAELLYRARPTKETLDLYGPLVDETARLLASWPLWDAARNRYVLGPPIVPVQENHPPLTTVNPTYELEAFRWGLIAAQKWRERRGLAREASWDRVIALLAPPAQADGLYLPVETEPDFWKVTRSSACSRNAHSPECLNRDHPSFLMAYGLIGGKVDVETMRRTLRAVEKDWDLRQTWGWDFPVIAMTAARLGEPGNAVDWLFRDLPNNKWGVSGMTPRVHLESERQLVGPAAGNAPAGPDGPGFRRAAETYFPSNGSLLLAVGMMAAGWDGSTGTAPGFPKQGWKVRVEGVQPLP